jgi:hypothetical protein
VLVLVNLTAAEINAYRLSLTETALADGAYSVLSLWDTETPTQKLVVAAGKFQEFRPVETLLPYSTHIYQVESN